MTPPADDAALRAGASIAREILAVRANGSTSEMTAQLNQLCDCVEDGLVMPVVQLDAESLPTEWPGDVDIRTVTRWERVLRRLETLPCATVCTSAGSLGAAALEIMLATDWRIGTKDTVIASSNGAWPSTCVYRMARQLGVTTSRRLIMRPCSIDATEALHLGLLDETVPDANALAAAAEQFADHVYARLSDAHVLRQLVGEAAAAQYDDAIGAHLAACDRTLRRRSGAADLLP